MDDYNMLLDNEPTISSDSQYAFAFDCKPTSAIIDVIEKELLHLKLLGSEKTTETREKYLGGLKCILINAGKTQQPNFVFDHLKGSPRIAHIQILEELVSFLSSELKTTVDLKPPIILKALYCLLSNDEVLFEGDDYSNIYNLCASSLKKFLNDSQESYALRYLLKDIAVDMLSELDSIFFSDSACMLLSPDCCLQESNEDFYGAVIAWLLNLTSETAAKLVPCAALYNKTLEDRSLNSLKMLNRLVSLCESYVYCRHSEIVDDTSRERSSLYDLNLVDQILYNLIRHEVVYTAICDVKCEPRISKPFQFCNLLIDEVKLRKLLYMNEYGYEANESDEKEMSDASSSPENQTLTTENLYEADSSESDMEGDSFKHMSSRAKKEKTEFQEAYFGHLNPLQKQICDVYIWEKSSTFYVSIPSSDSDPFNLKWIGLDTYNPFGLKHTKKRVSVHREKCKKKPRSLSP